jgi:DivIVA domain-containing protein
VTVIVIVLLGIVILVGVALLLAVMGGGMEDESADHVDLGLPDRPLTPDDIGQLRFRTGLRGYRMEDVDAALEQIAATMRAAQLPTDT